MSYRQTIDKEAFDRGHPRGQRVLIALYSGGACMCEHTLCSWLELGCACIIQSSIHGELGHDLSSQPSKPASQQAGGSFSEESALTAACIDWHWD